jgi:hypothetical protein
MRVDSFTTRLLTEYGNARAGETVAHVVASSREMLC